MGVGILGSDIWVKMNIYALVEMVGSGINRGFYRSGYRTNLRESGGFGLGF